MSTVTDTLDRARSDARKLHEKIAAATAKNDDALRKELQEVADKAQQLAASLRSDSKGQQSEVAAHLASAAASLESAVASAKDTAHVRADELRERNRMMLTKVRSALKNISSGKAAERAFTAKSAK